MPDFIRRALRTFAQAFVGVLVTSNVFALLGTTPAVDWAEVRKVVVSAVLAGVTALVTLVQNWAEDSPSIPFPALLKAVPSPGAHPVTVDPPVPVKKAAKRVRAAKKKA